METIFQVLAEPRRVDILRLIREDELAASEIARHFEVTRPAISQHLRILMNAGLVAQRREGTRRLYKLRPEGLRELQQFMREFARSASASVTSAPSGSSLPAPEPSTGEEGRRAAGGDEWKVW